MNKGSSPALLLGRLSLPLVLGLAPLLLAAPRVLVIDNRTISERDITETRAWRLLKRLRGSRPTDPIGHTDHPSAKFEANRALADFIAGLEVAPAMRRVAARFRPHYDETGIVRGIQMRLVNLLAEAFYCRTVAEKLTASGHSIDILWPGDDPFGLFRDRRSGFGFLACGFAVQGVLRNLLIGAFALTLMLFGNLWRRVPNVEPREVPFAVHIVSGRFSAGESPGVASIIYDSRFLEDGGRFQPQNILYVFGQWNASIPKARIEEIFSQVAASGGMAADESECPPDYRHLRETQFGRLGRIGLGMLARMPFVDGTEALSSLAALLFLRHINTVEIFCRHYRPSAFLAYDDQSPLHIARTLVFSRLGLRNLGMQHPLLPGIGHYAARAFVHFHLYLLHCPGFADDFGPYWKDMPTRVVGLAAGDVLFHYLRECPEDPTPTILITPPGDEGQILPRRIREFWQGVADFAERRPETKLILRPRSALLSGIVPDPDMERLLAAGRLELPGIEFSTYELIAKAEMVVAMLGSTVMLEAMAARRAVVGFDFTGLGDWSGFRLDRGLYATTAEELVRRIDEAIDSSFVSNAPHPSLVAPLDGRTVMRVREVMIEGESR